VEMCHCKTCSDKLHVIIVITAIAVPYSLTSCIIRFPFYTHVFRSFLRVSYALLLVITWNFRLLQRHFPDVTLTPARITDITLSRMTRAGSHFVPRFRHPLPTKKVKKVEIVEHFQTIHMLRSLPHQGGGGDVCKVWFRNVNLYEVQTNKQMFSFIYKNRRLTCKKTCLILLMHVFKLEFQVFASVHTYVRTRGDPIPCLCR
jgi:hypothetical protein